MVCRGEIPGFVVRCWHSCRSVGFFFSLSRGCSRIRPRLRLSAACGPVTISYNADLKCISLLQRMFSFEHNKSKSTRLHQSTNKIVPRPLRNQRTTTKTHPPNQERHQQWTNPSPPAHKQHPQPPTQQQSQRNPRPTNPTLLLPPRSQLR